MVTSTKNAEHYTWGENCDGWHLLRSDSLSVIQECLPPGTGEQMHYHHHAQQVFYVLSGQAKFIINEEAKFVARNESIHVDKGVKHRILNNGPDDLHILVISEPKAHGDRSNV